MMKMMNVMMNNIIIYEDDENYQDDEDDWYRIVLFDNKYFINEYLPGPKTKGNDLFTLEISM